MRAWPLHIVFATILAGSLAAKERAADVLDIDNTTLDKAVTRVAESQGLDFQTYGTITATNIPALAFAAPGCTQPVFVASRMVFDDEPLVRPARRYAEIRYIFIDRSWDRPNRLALFIARLKYGALAAFGLSPYVPSGRMLLVAVSPACPGVAGLDWRNVWNRDYMVVAATKATTR